MATKKQKKPPENEKSLENETACKVCKQSFSGGRFDKKFCSTKCKNTYNNKNRSQKYHLTKEINKILQNNRDILQSFYRQNEVHRKELEDKGYNFIYSTHQVADETDTKRFVFVYDFGLEQLFNDYFKIHYYGRLQINRSL